MSKFLGVVVVVDELSLCKEEEVRVKVKCLDSSKLRAVVRMFFNDDGFDLSIALQPPNHVGCPRFSGDGPPADGQGDPDDYHGRQRHPHHFDVDDEGSEESCSPSPLRTLRPFTTARGGGQ
ncbi:hypothetical protein ZWY2020_013930 [Hordeum vulgare]|nr:hypothetical protein ZWY2020_013930 [Hordeum vulgare]